MQVGIDKESQHVCEQDIARLKAQVATDNRRIGELNQLINARNHKLIALTKQGAGVPHPGGLTAEGLAMMDQ